MHNVRGQGGTGRETQPCPCRSAGSGGSAGDRNRQQGSGSTAGNGRRGAARDRPSAAGSGWARTAPLPPGSALQGPAPARTARLRTAGPGAFSHRPGSCPRPSPRVLAPGRRLPLLPASLRQDETNSLKLRLGRVRLDIRRNFFIEKPDSSKPLTLEIGNSPCH
ncbi:uncharacterized protein LOC128784022 isoform X2 [Vidua chalybeata]|uniref:uncharacterized protein LOC128784022 isoform X2 n=1 Tax=Vidua chalybeata TaxID=81927 RepID=UPI0023A8B131|nr:uncharacterized protein LOC128784022 isoform X2 [Vidua chalybeata]